MLEQGNPPGQAVLLGANVAAIAQLCFDAQAIVAAYQDVGNYMLVIPSDASLGSHSIAAIGTSGAVASLPLQVVPDFGPELSVPSLPSDAMAPGLSPVLGQQESPYLPVPIGNFPPIDNQWLDVWPDHPKGDWSPVGESGTGTNGPGYFGAYDGGFRFTHESLGQTIPVGEGGITVASIDGGRYAVQVSATSTVDPDAAAVTASFVGIFVCGLDAGSTATNCNVYDAAAIGNPMCQTDCRYASDGHIRLLLFPVAPSGHQAMIAK